MSAAGLPVPSGFTITTDACLRFYEAGRTFPDGLQEQVDRRWRELEERTGKRFGSVENPLLVSVRSGARVSMPGMMDTIFNLGLNDETVAGLARLTENERFAWDAYRRFIMMFSNVVLGIDKHEFEELIDDARKSRGAKNDAELDAATWKPLVDRFKAIVREHTGQEFPQDVREQLRCAIEAVFDSWNSKRAVDYRRFNRIPDDWGTAVTVMEMVFGNMGDDSGTGVAFTRNPNTGERALFGEYLNNAQGEDVVAGIRTPEKIADLARRQPQVYAQFEQIAQRLERHYRDVQDLEFTIERGKLFMLQTRNAKRTAEAAVKIALDLVAEGLIDRRRAVGMVNAQALDQLFHARIDPNEKAGAVCKGLNASPGAAAGQVVFSADDAVAWKERGRKTILVRNETTPDDVHGMIAAEGILTAKGGATSHAAVVARGMGKPCVAGCDALRIDRRTKHASLGGRRAEGRRLDHDRRHDGQRRARRAQPDSPAESPARLARDVLVVGRRAAPHAGVGQRRHAGGCSARARLGRARHRLVPHRAHVHAARTAADRPSDDHGGGSARSVEGAREAPTVSARRLRRHLEGDGRAARDDSLLDPPLHEFLPSLEQLLVETTELRLKKGADSAEYRAKEAVLRRVQQLHEQNPMLGLRVCRLGIVFPEIYEMQVRAIFEAACDLKSRGIDARPDVMIPGVGTKEEMQTTRAAAKRVADAVLDERGVTLPYRIGTMIELPRACIVADELAEYAEFFSFGTNDLTQTTYGYSRDDAEGIVHPGLSREADSQGRSVPSARPARRRSAHAPGRRARPRRAPGSQDRHLRRARRRAEQRRVLRRLGLDYVSCSPYRVPIARLAAAQAAIGSLS